MTDWKAVGLGSITNVVLTIVLSLAFFPLFFLGPLAGGLLTVYFSREYEDEQYHKDGAVDGALSGIIGGLIIGLLFILGFGVISAVVGLIFTNIGILAGTITLIVGLFVTFLSVLVGGVLGAIGGVIGVSLKQK